MDEKTRAIENQIRKGMPGSTVQHSATRSLHKFQIQGGVSSAPHWLYLSYELVADSSPAILINLLNIYHVTDTLNKAANSKWLLLTASGIREVDEAFAKQ